MSEKKGRLSRREFLKGAAITSGALVVGGIAARMYRNQVGRDFDPARTAQLLERIKPAADPGELRRGRGLAQPAALLGHGRHLGAGDLGGPSVEYRADGRGNGPHDEGAYRLDGPPARGGPARATRHW